MPMSHPSVVAAAALMLAACSELGFAPPAGSPGATAAAPAAPGRPAASSALTVADQAFLAQAAYGGLAEVALGQLAQRQGSSQAVRDFGRRMVTDHGRANEELVALARSKGVTPPTAPDPGRQEVASALASLQGANFDRQYLQEQLAEHEVAIALYNSEANSGTDPQVRAFAARTLPTLQEHAQQVRALLAPMARVAR